MLTWKSHLRYGDERQKKKRTSPSRYQGNRKESRAGQPPCEAHACRRHRVLWHWQETQRKHTFLAGTTSNTTSTPPRVSVSLETTRTENRPLFVVPDALSPRSAFSENSPQKHHTRFERQMCALSVRFCGTLIQIHQYRVGHTGASEFSLTPCPVSMKEICSVSFPSFQAQILNAPRSWLRTEHLGSPSAFRDSWGVLSDDWRRRSS